MNEESLLNKNSIRFLYYRYKDSLYYQLIIIGFIIIVCIILFFRIVVPQIENWISIRNEIIATRARIDAINYNISFMNNLDKEEVKDQFDTATAALPFDKDFGSMVDALTDASINSGVFMDDFSFQVGDIASTSAKESPLQKDFSTVDLSVSVSGNTASINKFLEEINKKLPLAEVVEISGDSFATTIKLQFYQKQFPKIVFKDDQPLSKLSDKDAEFLRELSSWRHIVEEEVSSSESAQYIPLF